MVVLLLVVVVVIPVVVLVIPVVLASGGDGVSEMPIGENRPTAIKSRVEMVTF